LVSLRATRFMLAFVLAWNELFRYWHYGIHFPNDLPLHLCSISTWMAVIGCLSLWAPAIEFAYFEGLAGATLALLNPDMPGKVKAHLVSYDGIRYFVEHGMLVITVSALIFGRITRLRRGSALRANLMLVVYATVLLIFNRVFHTNYLYLLHKPSNPSPLDFFGPWPIYLFAAELVAIVLFWMLWLPVRQAAVPKPIPAGEHPSGGAGANDTRESTQPLVSRSPS
jgi:hypothetical integral membrane protein (TIGR02206 family)